MKKSKAKKRGFTLIELVIVIGIIAILAAIAIPRYQVSRQKAAEVAHKSNVSMLKSAAVLKQNEMEEETVTWEKNNEDAKKYIEKWPELPNELKSEKNKDYTVVITQTSITVTPDEDYNFKNTSN